MKKLLTSISVIALSAAGVLPTSVLANEVSEPDTSSKQPTVVKNRLDSKQEALQQKVDQAKAVEEQKYQEMVQAGVVVQQNEASEVQLQTQYEAAQQSTQEAGIEINDDLVNALQQRVDELEKVQKDLDTATSQKADLEKDLQEKQSKVDDAQKRVDKANEDLSKAQAEADKISDSDYAKAEKEAQDAQAALEQAQADLASAKANQQSLQSELSSLQGQLEAAKQAVVTAQSQQVSAQQKLSAAQADLQAKQAILDGIGDDESAKEAAQQAVNTAQAAVNSAQAELTNAQSAQEAAQAQVDSITAQLATDKANVDAAQKAVDSATDAVAEAQIKYNNAQYKLDDLQAEHQNYVDQVNNYNNQIASYQTELDNCKNTLASLQNDVQNLNSQIQAKEAEIADLNKQIEDSGKDVPGVNDKSSLDFFHSIGANGVDDVYNKVPAQYRDKIHIGAQDDATSLDNMKSSLKFIRECNELRKKNGLNELKVSPLLMVYSQYRTDISAYLVNHVKGFGNLGENLAWGYDDPFDGWYYEEKQVAEYAKEHNLNINNAADKQKIADALDIGLSHVQTGHYYNVIRDTYDITGFSMNQYGNYGTTHGQTFATQDWGDFPDNKVYTIDEFEKLFNDYYDALVDGGIVDPALAKKLDDAKKELAQLQDAKNDKDFSIQAIQDEINSVAPLIEKVTASRDAAQKQADVLAGQIADDEKTVASANEDLKKAEADLSNKKDVLKQAQATLEEHGKSLNLDKAQADLDAAKKDVADKQKALEEAQANLKKAQETLDNLGNVSKEEAQKAVDEAKANVEKAQSELNTANENLTQAKENEANVQTSVEAKANEVADAVIEVTAKQEAVKKAQDASDIASKTLKDYDDKRKAVSDLKDAIKADSDTIDALNKEITEGKTQVEELSQSITDNTTEKDKLTKEKAEVERLQAEFDNLKSGKDGSLATSLPELGGLETKGEAYKELVKAEQEAKAQFDEVKSKADASRAEYQAAKEAYEKAKAARIAAEKELQDYLDSLKGATKPVVVTTPSTKEVQKTSKQATTPGTKTTESGVNTGAETNLMVYVGGTVLSGALAAMYLGKKRKED